MKLKVFFFVFLCLETTGCSFPLKVRIYNTLDSVIFVVKQPKDSAVIEYKIPSKAFIDIEAIEGNDFYIRYQSQAWKYSKVYMPPGYPYTEGFGPFVSRIVKLRLEDNGVLFILKEEEDYDAALSEQPDGFPLSPVSNGAVH